MSTRTSWLGSSPKGWSPPIWLPGLSLSSQNTSTGSSSKAHQRSSVWLLSLGSPISPLLFVIYIASLHPTIPQCLAISYVDDHTIMVSSDSIRSNICALQHHFGIIRRQGTDLGVVAFSVPLTELIHWRTPKDCSDVSFTPIVINNMLFPPSQAIRWLRYKRTTTIQSSIHFRRRLALALASFTTIRQLSAAGKGLASWCNRKLVFGAILPILTYGCDLFIPDNHT